MHRLDLLALLALLTALVAAGCSSSQSPSEGPGGEATAGETTGGSTATTGGTGTGGDPATGGASTGGGDATGTGSAAGGGTATTGGATAGSATTAGGTTAGGTTAGGTTGGATGDTAPTYYRDVKPIVDTMCTRCHGPGGIKESLSFTSYEAIKPWALAIRAQVEMRAMPPWQAGGGCADYAFDESLTEDEIATVISWADAGAPQGDPSGDVNEMRTVTFAQLTREDVSIEMPVPYLPQIAPDDYRCFLVEWPKDTTQFITGFGARPGNPAVVHHIIAYLVYPEATDTFRAWDDAEEGPGYTCFGGPSGPGGGVSGFGKSTRFIGGWAPGGVGADFPAGTGMRVPPGSLIALQVHYNTLGVGPEEDQTRVVFKVDDQVEKEAFVIPWTNFQWLAGIGMEIPAGQKEVTHAYSGSPLDFGLLNGATALRLYTATLHMHTLGVRGSVAIRRADGTSECLVEYPRYDFNWQRSFGFETPKLLKKGDKIEIECTWDNSAEHQPIFGGTQLEPHDVHWGEGTTDEMCIAFFYATIE